MGKTPHDAALDRAGNVFMWVIDTGPLYPAATPEGAAMQIIRMYLTEMDQAGDVHAEALLKAHFASGPSEGKQ